jgi:hypothetical protein
MALNFFRPQKAGQVNKEAKALIPAEACITVVTESQSRQRMKPVKRSSG